MTQKEKIEENFVHKLEVFAAQGYAFDDEHALRDGTQREAFDAYTKDFAKGHRHGYFEIPTGVGKTALFTAIAKKYLEAVNGEKDGPRVLITVPSEKLAVQTAKSFAKFFPEIAPSIEADDDAGKEIDWENSDMGLQYGKMKHASRKPRILITTYQSLIRDVNNTTYPPADYGMVIYDEGHALTADKFGQATDKFKDSIQLAVTATPEYSAEKTVASRLPHRYFQLPLKEAINKDLCNVRSVLLRTNFTIDEKKFSQLMERRHGQALSEKELTGLLNQEVRNNAAMETYLLGKDPDSHEPYLGQNGMIFCGTTGHADDFSRQFEKMISKPKYKQVRDWLKHENIEIIAPVHGKTIKQCIGGKMQHGAWLRAGLIEDDKIADRPKMGVKQFYTENEIFDLHHEGKILLLASVAKLKWGYDAPRDSFVLDLVDRLSKVDATQINGRGFRLNPDHLPDPATNDPGKTCTVINLVDNNTYDLYKDKPHMLPIYCAEIIEGAEFRTPTARPHLMKRFTKQPPDMDETLVDSGFSLLTDVERVREVSKEYRKAREQYQLPEKTADDLTLSVELPKALEIDGKNPTYLIWRKHAEAKLNHGVTVMVGSYPLQKKQSGTHKVYCLPNAALPELAQQLGITLTGSLPEKTTNDLTLGNELPKALGIHPENPTYLIWRKHAEAKLNHGETVMVGSYPIQQKQSGKHKAYCLSNAALPELAQQLGITLTGSLPEKTVDDLALSAELPKALGMSYRNPTYLTWRKLVETKLHYGESVMVGSYPIQQKQSGPNKAYCLPDAALPELARQLGITFTSALTEKTVDDMTLSKELPEALGTSNKNLIYLTWRKHVEAKLDHGEP